MHYVNWPIGDLQNLKHFALSEARNVAVNIPNGDVIRGWHIPPPGPDTLHALRLEGEAREVYMDAMLANSSKIVVYLHGTAANRGYYKRRALAKSLSSFSGSHVLAFDYRGFGDSSGSPSELATTEDVFYILEWIRSRVPSEVLDTLNVVLYGQSLGTGVSIAYLHKYRDHAPHSFIRGVILDSPFTSLPEAAMSHPVGAAFRILPPVRDFM
jgi:abhydrolase domain-containing protein 12